MNQFFGRHTWKMVAAIAAMHLLAVFVRDSSFALPVLVIIGLATFAVSIKSLPAALFIAVAEIIVGGHGHLLSSELFGFSASLRMVIFGAVMLGWVTAMIRKRAQLRILPARDVVWGVLALAIALGTVIGFTQNDPMKAFDDMNGFLVLGYLLPFLSINWTATVKRDLLQTFGASVLWLIIFTLGLAFAFNHLDGKTLSHVYTFVRDARLAEITLQTDARIGGEADPAYWYRIFMQSHFYVTLLMLFFTSALLFLWREQRVPAIVNVFFALMLATFVLSMSRSFTLGFLAAGACLVPLALAHGSKRVKNVSIRLVLCGALLAAGIATATFVSIVPPKRNITEAAFYSTSGDIDRDLAISSRWQLLPEMMEEIWASPLIGSGFGEEVTFISDDPRVRAMNESGAWTTYRFEWGWQDLWLKMGILGVLTFVFYAYVFGRACMYTMKKHGNAWLPASFGVGIVMLFVAHVFTPFLNHPIGLLALMMPIPFFDWDIFRQRGAVATNEDGVLHPAAVKMAPVATMEEEG